MATGVGYEFGWGDDEVLQDTDELRLWLSANKGFESRHRRGAILPAVLPDSIATVIRLQ